MKNTIFRKVSIERLSSPEQLDQMITVTDPRGWIVLLTVLFMLMAFGIWAFFGSIKTSVDGRGILLKSGGVRNIIHYASGQLYDIKVAPGDMVREGEVIARIDRGEIVDEILQLKKDLELIDSVTDQEGYRKLEESIKELQSKLEAETNIVSQYSGRVLEVRLNKWDMLQAGEPLISIEPMGDGIKDLEGLFYISAKEGNKLGPGMEVFLSPSSVKKEDYGYMIGKVVTVSDYPVTHQNMVKTLGSDELAEVFSQSGPVVEVHVDIISNSSTISGYQWTNSMGPAMKINSGTLCEGRITLSSQRPISMILPVE